GLIPALRALVSDFQEWSGLPARFDGPAALPPMPAEAELALFRAVQEGLSNVARHAQARAVTVTLACEEGIVRLAVEDDGAGLPAGELARVSGGPGRSGLFGMRERLASQGGEVRLAARNGGGLRLEVSLPMTDRGGEE
ncbi:MAG TPA: ATP-binding protein, partial [Gemmatimonadales bacterium]